MRLNEWNAWRDKRIRSISVFGEGYWEGEFVRGKIIHEREGKGWPSSERWVRSRYEERVDSGIRL